MFSIDLPPFITKNDIIIYRDMACM